MGSSNLLQLLFLIPLIAAVSPAAAQLDLWSHECNDDYGNYTSNSTYKLNLNKLLTKISTTDIPYGFYNFSAGKDPDQANVIALCRGDVAVADCHTCLKFATSKLTRFCPNQKEAIGWADNCMLRYSSRSILGGEWETDPVFPLVTGVNATDVDHLSSVVAELLASLLNKTANGDSRLKFATGEANVSASWTVYALTQCTPDLSRTDCLGCLYEAIYGLLDWCRGQTGARVLVPSCSARFEHIKFYSLPDPQQVAAAPLNPTSSRNGKGSGHLKIVIIVVLAVLACLSLLVNTLVCCCLRQKRKPTESLALELDDGDETSGVESLQLDFSKIRDATQNSL